MLLSSTVLVIGHTGENDIGSMLFRELILNCADWLDRRLLRRRSQLARRQRRQSFTLGDLGELVALPGGVVGRLRAAVKVAGSIKCLLEGEGGQPSGLATFLTLGAGLPSGC